MIATSKIEMDLNWYDKPKIEAIQDDKYSRNVEISLVTDGTPWEIPGGAAVVVNYVKPDGTGGEYDTMPNGETAWSASGNVLTVKLAPQVLTVAGMVHMGVTLILEHKAISTFQIAINVQKNVAAMLTASENYKRIAAFIPMPDNAVAGQYIVVEEVDDTGKITKVRTEPSTLPQVADLLERVADLEYEPIEIVSIKDGGIHEIGTVLDAVTISWALSKEPVRQHLNLEDIGADVREMVVEGPIDSGKAWLLEVWDEREAKASASASVVFLNGVYYGALAAGTQIDSAVIRGLNRKLQAGRAVTFTAGGDGLRPVYACPRRYGTPTFTIAGFEYGWELVNALTFVNASGYEEIYDVWMHGQDVAEAIRVVVA